MSIQEDNSWTHLDEYNEGTNRRGHSAVVYKNKMIVFGGAADAQSVNTVYQWHLGMFLINISTVIKN